jgi:hypothetical protein
MANVSKKAKAQLAQDAEQDAQRDGHANDKHGAKKER